MSQVWQKIRRKYSFEIHFPRLLKKLKLGNCSGSATLRHQTTTEQGPLRVVENSRSTWRCAWSYSMVRDSCTEILLLLWNQIGQRFSEPAAAALTCPKLQPWADSSTNGFTPEWGPLRKHVFTASVTLRWAQQSQLPAGWQQDLHVGCASEPYSVGSPISFHLHLDPTWSRAECLGTMPAAQASLVRTAEKVKAREERSRGEMGEYLITDLKWRLSPQWWSQRCFPTYH